MLNTIGAIEYLDLLFSSKEIDLINEGISPSTSNFASLYFVRTTASVALPSVASSRTTLFARRAAPLLIFIEA